ncbi:MAG: hypothetical protein AB3N15_18480 [Paracoccaceae bacterium]
MWRCVLVSLVAACGAASPEFRRAPVMRVAVDGSVFDIRVRGGLAEAVRVNPQYAPRLGPIGSRAGAAMEQVSGCQVVGVLGDQAVMTGVLDCESRPKDWALLAAAGRER